jgi:hypothetical protein
MSVVPTFSAVEETQPLSVASTSTSNSAASLAEPQEVKMDEPADAHMSLQEGEGVQLITQNASSADEAVVSAAAAAADSNPSVASTQDGSDAIMENGGGAPS